MVFLLAFSSGHLKIGLKIKSWLLLAQKCSVLYPYFNITSQIFNKVSLTLQNFALPKLFLFWSLILSYNFIGKDPDVGKYWRQKEKGVAKDEIVSITNSVDMNLSKPQKIVKDRGAWSITVHGVAKSWIQPTDWRTRATYVYLGHHCIFLQFLVWSSQ